MIILFTDGSLEYRENTDLCIRALKKKQAFLNNQNIIIHVERILIERIPKKNEDGGKRLCFLDISNL
jgi:hypothetical protein